MGGEQETHELHGLVGGGSEARCEEVIDGEREGDESGKPREIKPSLSATGILGEEVTLWKF